MVSQCDARYGEQQAVHEIAAHVEDHTWALVLAGGEGKRLKSLTTTAEGIAIPKQYCSLYGDVTLLDNALQRAHAVTHSSKVVTLVAAQHRQWWNALRNDYSSEQIVVQPDNRGTALGIMLPLLHIVRQDPQAHIVLLPSDHHVQDEATLQEALQQAKLRLKEHRSGKIIMLGIEPDEADCELGYVVPGRFLGDGCASVATFVEKPPLLQAHWLLSQGALWNTFIVAAHAGALLQLFMRQCAGVLDEMRDIIQLDCMPMTRRALLEELYRRMPVLDFSRDIMQGNEALLEVQTVPACGWSDLGTPRRIREVLHRWPAAVQHNTGQNSTHIPVTLAEHAGFIVSKSLTGNAYRNHASDL